MTTRTSKTLFTYNDRDKTDNDARTPSPPLENDVAEKQKGKSKRRHKNQDYDSCSSTSSSVVSSPVRYKSRTKRKRGDSGSRSTTAVLEMLASAIKDRNNTGISGLQGSQNVIPDFDPQSKSQTIKHWLGKINEIANVYGWSDRQTIFYSLPKLTGLARKWYDGLTTVKYTWAEWQVKLLNAFSCEENYGELLTEMLARKSRKNESLEEYYYDKIMLINRCNLSGKEAVDCLSHGIFDNNIRMNIQGARFREPEQVLKYFRSVATRSYDMTKTFKPVSRVNNDQKRASSISSVRCYNCHEPGHIVSKCPKPVVKCRKCRRYGHVEVNCSMGLIANKSREYTEAKEKVLSITENNRDNDKYFKDVVVHGQKMRAFVDFGSQCTIMREDLGKRLGVPIDKNNLPVLTGFGKSIVRPSARIIARVILDGVDEEIEIYLVDLQWLCADILIGHSLTELPGVRVYKTDSILFMYKDLLASGSRVRVTSTVTNRIFGVTTVAIATTPQISGLLYIDTELCMREGKEYAILPGIYTVNAGFGSVLVIGLSCKEFTLDASTLLARASIISNTPQQHSPQRSVGDVNILRVNIDDTDCKILKEQIIIDADLDEQVLEQLLSTLNSRRDCFAFSLAELGKTSLAEMQINLKDSVPVTYRPYRISLAEREKVKTIVNELLDSGIIRESTSEYASPIILVAKKNGEVRMCVDYRALNHKTVKEKFPMPLIDDQIDKLSGQVFFSTLDLASGYHQVPVSESSKHLTAFVTPDGHYEYNRMPFGLTNAPAVFQRLILNLLKQRNIPGVLAYMDDVIIASRSLSEGIDRLSAVLDLIKKANLTLNLKKCHFFKRTIEYLGFEISSNGVRPGLRKIEAVSEYRTPENVHEVRQFIGLVSFFRRFVAGFACIAKPLTSLTRSNVVWAWGDEQEKAFKELKAVLISRPVLAIFNPEYLTELHTDASASGLGGILLQRADDSKPLHAVAYFSRQTSKDEQHFHSYELETLAVVASLNRFRVYLLGIEFKVVTDCNALRTTLTKRDLIPRIARWWLLVQEYTFTIEFRPGSQLVHADALSRNSINVSDVNNRYVMQIGDVHWLQSVQMSDPRLIYIKAVLDSKSTEAKDIQDKYELKEGKIYKKINGELRWAVPKDARWKICQQCHDESGHFAFEKTLEKITRDYWFPRMTQFVKKYVRACIPCAYAKQVGGKRQGELHPITKPSVPFQCLHIDHLGPFIKSKKGNTYILGIIDSFTKFIILRAVKNTKSKTSINVLRDVFSLFGTPKTLISDRGSSFTSNEFKLYVRSTGLKHILNAVATPRANGQIERYNRSILSALIALCHGYDDRNWDLHVADVQWSLNNTVNQSTGKCPTKIIFGRESVNKNESHLHELGHGEPITTEAIEKIRGEATSNIELQQNKMKLRYDKKRCNARKYKVGDLVMVEKSARTPGESNKLIPPFNGPYKVTAVFDHDRYEVSSVEGYSKKKYKNVFPVDKMKPWIRFAASDSDSEFDDSD